MIKNEYRVHNIKNYSIGKSISYPFVYKYLFKKIIELRAQRNMTLETTILCVMFMPCAVTHNADVEELGDDGKHDGAEYTEQDITRVVAMS